MKKLNKTRNVLSATALTAVLSAALVTSPVMAGENDTYKTIHNGYLSEYQVNPNDVVASSGSRFSAVSAENETFVTIHNGWLSEVESQNDGSKIVAMSDIHGSDAYSGAKRKDWLSNTGFYQ